MRSHLFNRTKRIKIEGPSRLLSTPQKTKIDQTMSTLKLDTQFKSVQSHVSPEEWQARVELAACYRLVDVYEMSDLIYNHITLKIPGTEHLLINLYGLLYKEITASSLAKIDIDGNILYKPDTDYGINKSGYVIHGAIHQARSDVNSVIHTHTRAGMAVPERAPAAATTGLPPPTPACRRCTWCCAAALRRWAPPQATPPSWRCSSRRRRQSATQSGCAPTRRRSS